MQAGGITAPTRLTDEQLAEIHEQLRLRIVEVHSLLRSVGFDRWKVTILARDPAPDGGDRCIVETDDDPMIAAMACITSARTPFVPDCFSAFTKPS